MRIGAARVNAHFSPRTDEFQGQSEQLRVELGDCNITEINKPVSGFAVFFHFGEGDKNVLAPKILLSGLLPS